MDPFFSLSLVEFLHFFRYQLFILNLNKLKKNASNFPSLNGLSTTGIVFILSNP